MKVCAACGRLYPVEAAYCQADGQRLRNASQTPAPTDSKDRRIGQLLLDRYLVYRVVADGGMGRVYEALDQHGQRQVALKILHEAVASDAVALERFKREYALSRKLPHEHIVEVLDFQPTPDGSFVLVMEFLVGEELRATLKRDRVLSPARLVRMVSQLALGLDAAHQAGLVHRDLKPDNLFLCQTRDGDLVKVLDFGSVKHRGASRQLTVMGTTIGSPYYMSPEQAQGLQSLDHRSDVWSLAAILYECVTGTVPFYGTSGPSILLQIMGADPIPPSQIAESPGDAAAGKRFSIPKRLDRVLLAALDKQAVHRTGSVGELADGVGAAYGLVGEHRSWAYTEQSHLEHQIGERARLPSEPPAADALGDEFFRRLQVSTPMESDSSAAPGARGRLWAMAFFVFALSLGVTLYFVTR